MREFTVNVKGEPVTFTSQFETLDDAVEVLKKDHARNSFASDLVEKHERFGLSDAQAAWVHKIASEEPRVQRAPLELDLRNIAVMLRNKPGKGRPKLTVADGVVVTLNSDKSKNPGHVSVTDGGPYKQNTYFGRIDDSGTVYPAAAFTDEVQQALVAFNNQGQEESNDIDGTDLPF